MGVSKLLQGIRPAARRASKRPEATSMPPPRFSGLKLAGSFAESLSTRKDRKRADSLLV